MDCENYSESSDDRFINQQEHRNVSRLWEKTINKFSSTKFVLDESGNNAIDICTKGNNLNVNTDYQGNCPGVCDEQLTSDFVQKKLARGKSFAKKKSPLQKFDEVVSRELLVSFKKCQNTKLKLIALINFILNIFRIIVCRKTVECQLLKVRKNGLHYNFQKLLSRILVGVKYQ